ncbi:DegV family protein [Periweissella beninensis]|uniref:DegV family protein n=1 Tax=Periweissella beninensis TaxID=504936 RepID=UPI0021A8D582|nr:DegV family protein [Periweissella beninensis]MCT4395760.1 DegV family protein [Periweissella beninensis]
MTKIKIVTDSSVQLTPEEISENNISIIPLSVEINETNYVDGVDITREEIVTFLKKGQIPKTSQPAIGKMVETFNQLGADGSHIIAIMMSDALSGTYQTAVNARDLADTDITVINSKSTDRGLAFQVLAAAADAKNGKSVTEIVAHCTDIKERTEISVLIDNLDALVQGGRLNRFAGALTNLLNIKIVVKLLEDGLHIVYKGRSRKSLLKYAREIHAAHTTNKIQKLSLSNVDTDAAFLDSLETEILDEQLPEPILRRLTSPIIMAHTGVNAVGVITLSTKKVDEAV